MKSFTKILMLGAAVLLAAPIAKADSFSAGSSISINAPATLTGTPGAYTGFSFTGTVTSVVGAGSFVEFAYGCAPGIGCGGSTVSGSSQNVSFTLPKGTVLFTVTQGSDTLSFMTDEAGVTNKDDDGFAVTGILKYCKSGVCTTGEALLSASAPGASGQQMIITSLTTPSATPEPSSLILLGTGLFSAAGVAFRRRKNAIA